MACNVNTTLANACTSGIGKLTNPIQLLQVIAQTSCEVAAGGGGGSGSGQIKTYVADPNAEGVVPDNTALPAQAYKADGTGSIYVWVINTLAWA